MSTYPRLSKRAACARFRVPTCLQLPDSKWRPSFADDSRPGSRICRRGIVNVRLGFAPRPLPTLPHLGLRTWCNRNYKDQSLIEVPELHANYGWPDLVPTGCFISRAEPTCCPYADTKEPSTPDSRDTRLHAITPHDIASHRFVRIILWTNKQNRGALHKETSNL